DSTLAAPPSSLQIPLHADVWLLDKPGRTLVRDPDRKADPARNPPQHPRAGGCPQAVRRDSQREPQAIRVDQDRRPDPRQHPSLLPTNFGDRTLDPMIYLLAVRDAKAENRGAMAPKPRRNRRGRGRGRPAPPRLEYDLRRHQLAREVIPQLVELIE